MRGKPRRESGRKRWEKGLLSPAERSNAPFRFCRHPQATPGCLGSARVRELLFRPKPALYEIPGVRLARFPAAGAKKRLGGLLEVRLEMLLAVWMEEKE